MAFRRELPWLDFEPVTHSYHLNGEKVPSVSELLGLAKFNTTRYGKDNSAAWKGTTAHTACEFDDEGCLDESTLDPRLKGYLAGWRAFRASTHFEPVLIEQAVGHRVLKYAGTLDRLGLIGGTLWLADIKTGARRDWHEIQLVGYLNAVEHCREELNIPKGPINCMTVYLTYDGGFNDVPVADPYSLIPVFEGAIPRARWQAARAANDD